MPLPRPSLARYTESLASTKRQAAREALEQRQATSSFPIIPKCPAPTCCCSEMPEMDIEHKANLNGSMAPYAEHVLISSGQHDWKSKIENEGDVPGWGQLTANLKTAFGRGGRYQDNIPKQADDGQLVNTEALLFPSFKHLNLTPMESDQLIKEWLLPENLQSCYENLPEEMKKTKIRSIKTSKDGHFDFNVQEIHNPTILICSHASRDSRCGVLGPLLREEFAKYFRSMDVGVEVEHFRPSSHKIQAEPTGQKAAAHTANIGLISHIGGHKWAGNVIVYIPPSWRQFFAYGRTEGQSKSPSTLAGMGIWYGRVEPKHVQGIVEETLVRGRVIKELFRGGIGQNRQILRL